MRDAAAQILDFFDKLFHRVELPVDAHEADVGDWIDAAQMLADVPAELLGRHLSIVAREKLFLDEINDLANGVVADG